MPSTEPPGACPGSFRPYTRAALGPLQAALFAKLPEEEVAAWRKWWKRYYPEAADAVLKKRRAA
jgi:hypothetical protein